MFRLIREADLAVRFYGPERLILSRRNGARYAVTGHLASLFHRGPGKECIGGIPEVHHRRGT